MVSIQTFASFRASWEVLSRRSTMCSLAPESNIHGDWPLAQVFRHRADLTDTGAARHDHGVGNRALSSQIDIDDIDRLVIIE